MRTTSPRNPSRDFSQDALQVQFFQLLRPRHGKDQLQPAGLPQIKQDGTGRFRLARFPLGSVSSSMSSGYLSSIGQILSSAAGPCSRISAFRSRGFGPRNPQARDRISLVISSRGGWAGSPAGKRQWVSSPVPGYKGIPPDSGRSPTKGRPSGQGASLPASAPPFFWVMAERHRSGSGPVSPMHPDGQALWQAPQPMQGLISFPRVSISKSVTMAPKNSQEPYTGWSSSPFFPRTPNPARQAASTSRWESCPQTTETPSGTLPAAGCRPAPSVLPRPPYGSPGRWRTGKGSGRDAPRY